MDKRVRTKSDQVLQDATERRSRMNGYNPPRGPIQPQPDNMASKSVAKPAQLLVPSLPEPDADNAATVTLTEATDAKQFVQYGLWKANNKSSDFAVGDVVTFSHFSLSLDKKDAAHHSIATGAGYVCGKLRMGVVMTVYSEEICLCPVLSSGGNGITRKTTSFHDAARIIQITGEWFPKQGSHLNLTNTQTIPLVAPMNKLSCRVTETSRIKLIRMYQEIIAAGRKGPGKQQEAFETAMKRYQG